MPTLQTSALKMIDEYEDDCTLACSDFYVQLVDGNVFYKDAWDGGAGAGGAEIFAPLFLIKLNFRNS